MSIQYLLSHPDFFIFLVIALVIGITIHEFSHALAATLLGDRTAKDAGRLTLNPLSHLDLMGSLMILVAQFGWGKPVPYNRHALKRGAWDEVLIAIAGPASNILIALVFGIPLRIYVAANAALPLDSQIYAFLAVVVSLNIFLAVFNLIPIPPLDGSKILFWILRSFNINPSFIMRLEMMGPVILLFIIFSDRLIGTNIVFTVLGPVIHLMEFFVGAVPR